jgi:hypothetical protein
MHISSAMLVFEGYGAIIDPCPPNIAEPQIERLCSLEVEERFNAASCGIFGFFSDITLTKRTVLFSKP